MKKFTGFTLIELLIVVAIIAILAAIAVPNFLEAQVRAKVSRAKNDMRSIATALEAYRTDNNDYVPDRQTFGILGGGGLIPLYWLTTPVAYMSSVPPNAFPNKNSQSESKTAYLYYTKGWLRVLTNNWTNQNLVALNDATGKKWVTVSIGPDLLPSFGEYILFGEDYVNSIVSHFGGTNGCLYDPTNGTMSHGDIVRAGP